MRYTHAEKMEIIRLVEESDLPVKRTLAELERGMHQQANAPAPNAEASPQLGLFAPSAPSAVERMLDEIDPDALSPREALETLYRLKSLG